MNSAYKNIENMALAFDIDGTLIPSSTSSIESRVLELLKQLSKTNKVILASARPMKGILNLIPTQFKGFFDYVSLNGAFTIIDGLEYISNPISYGHISRFIKDFINKDLWLYSKDKWYSSNHKSAAYLKERNAVKYDALEIGAYRPSTEILKVILITDNTTEMKAIDSCDLEVHKSNNQYVEINAKGVNKALFIEQISLNKNCLCSFGDADNDIPLLQASKFAINMDPKNTTLQKISSYDVKERYYLGLIEGLSLINDKIK